VAWAIVVVRGLDVDAAVGETCVGVAHESISPATSTTNAKLAVLLIFPPVSQVQQD
jgi:hypothetical protein